MFSEQIDNDKALCGLDQQQLLQSMIVDNAGRAKSGTFTFPVIWLIIGFGSGWYQQQPVLFFANLGFLLCFSAIRFWVLHTIEARVEANSDHARLAYLSVVLTNALHWGLLSATGIYSEQWNTVELPLLMSVGGFAAAATSTMGIDRYIRFLFPGFMLIPVVCVLLINFDVSNGILAFLALVFALYLTNASASHRDYWHALRRGMLLEKKAAEFQRLSVTDTLTQINNRLYFESQLEAEWGRMRRSKASLAICLIDLDQFKQLNDKHGHAFGDYCLRHTASVLQQQMRRSGDVVARYGGEEFILLLPNTDLKGAEHFANQIRQAICAVQLVQGEHLATVFASIGVAATSTDNQLAADKLIQQADEALYRAKALGRNRVEIFAA